jgi:hypothetical protein
MSELNERRWAVVSERGREAAGMTYDEAASLMRRLADERVHGRCIVSDEAAARLDAARSTPDNGRAPEAAKKPRARRKRAVSD